MMAALGNASPTISGPKSLGRDTGRTSKGRQLARGRKHATGHDDSTSRISRSTANLRTKIVDFRGFASSRILILRGGILVSIGKFPESLSQAILVGIILVGRLGVPPYLRAAVEGRM